MTAGASAPEWLVDDVVARLAPGARGRESSPSTDEEEYFPPPPELRDLLRAVWSAAQVAVGRPAAGQPPAVEDREVPAARMLTGRVAAGG